MIEKKIFFSWIGDIRDFVYFSTEIFQKINSDFEVVFKHFTVQYLEDIFNTKDLKNLSTEDKFIKFISNITYKRLSTHVFKYPRPFIMLFNDYYRVFLLKKYGGIYLDCDTFPIKPFDDKLLSKEYFWSQRKISQDQKKPYVESNFFGTIKNRDDNLKFKLLPCIHEYRKTNELQNKFYSCNLKYGEYYGDPEKNYIDHYGCGSWKKECCKVPKTMMDELLIDKTGIKFL